MSAKSQRVLPGFGLALGYTLVYLSLLILLPLGGMVLKASELGFGQICVRPFQVGGQVFDRNGALQTLLNPLHIGAHHREGFVGAGHGTERLYHERRAYRL